MKTNLKSIFTLLAAFALTLGTATAACAATASKNPVESSANDKKAKNICTVTFKVHLHCESCVKKVNENIAFEKGVKDLKVSLEDQTVTIKYDASKTDEAKLANAIEKLGYEIHKTDN